MKEKISQDPLTQLQVQHIIEERDGRTTWESQARLKLRLLGEALSSEKIAVIEEFLEMPVSKRQAMELFAARTPSKHNRPEPVLARYLPALARYLISGGQEEPNPLERLRFFCSLAMGPQDWLDVEPSFTDVENALK